MNEELEIPDLGTEEEQLAALEAITLDIDGFLNGVQEAGGVSRAMAEKASHLLPEETNYAYYSQTPTQTNLKVTLESIDLKTALVIAGAVAAVAVLALKIFQYIKKSREKIEFTIKKLDGHVESTERCLKVCDRIVANMNSEAKAKVDEITKQLNEQYQQQISGYFNPFLKEIITNGKVAHVIADAHKVASGLFEKVKSSVDLLEKLVDAKDVSVEQSQLVDPKDLSLPQALSHITKFSSETASSAMSEIMEGLTSMRDIKVEFRHDLEEVFQRNKGHTGSDSKVYGRGFHETATLEKRVEKIEQKVSKNKDLDADHRAAINKVSYSLRSGLQQLMTFTRMCSMASSGSRQFWMSMEKYAATKLKRVAALAVQDDDAEVKKALEHASKIKL
jgi:hypothetical protein